MPHKPASPLVEQQPPPPSACTPPLASTKKPSRYRATKKRTKAAVEVNSKESSSARPAPKRQSVNPSTKKVTPAAAPLNPRLSSRSGLVESSNEDIQELLAQLARLDTENVLRAPPVPSKASNVAFKMSSDVTPRGNANQPKIFPLVPEPHHLGGGDDPNTRDIHKLLSTFISETDWCATSDNFQRSSTSDGPPGYVPHVAPPNLKASAPLPASYVLPQFSPNYYEAAAPYNVFSQLQGFAAADCPTTDPTRLEWGRPGKEGLNNPNFSDNLEEDDADSNSLTNAPPPGIALGAHELIKEASMEHERQRLNQHKMFLRKVDPASVPLVLSAPQNVVSQEAAQERLQVATYQSDFPTLGEGSITEVMPKNRGRATSNEVSDSARSAVVTAPPRAPTSQSTQCGSVRPLTRADRQEPYPKNWLKPPADVDVEAGSLWMNSREITYIARQQVSQTARAQQDFTRPKTLQRDDTIVLTASMERDFLLNTPARCCVCYMIKSSPRPIFGVCKSPYCGEGYADINRAIAARIKLCHEAQEAEDILFALLLEAPVGATQDVSRVSAWRDKVERSSMLGPRLVDVLSKEVGREKACDLWFLITAQAHPGRYDICHTILRNSCLLSYICTQVQQDSQLCRRLRTALATAMATRQVPRDIQAAESLTQALLYEIELASVDELRAPRLASNYWIKLGLLLLLTMVDELREARKRGGSGSNGDLRSPQMNGRDLSPYVVGALSSMVLTHARLIYAGIEETFRDLMNGPSTAADIGVMGSGGAVSENPMTSRPKSSLSSALVKNPLAIHPGLHLLTSSTFFLTLAALIYSTPCQILPIESGCIAPPALANAPLTNESAYRLLYRLTCLSSVESLDQNIHLTECRLFLKSSLYCAGTDNFCASALHETCGQSKQFRSAEKLVIWVCDKLKPDT